MYKANILDVKINLGTLIVDVLFYDEHNEDQKLSDTFQTNQFQDNNWIGEQITRRLSHLNSLPFLKESIQIGPFNKIKIKKSEKELYREKADQYMRFMNVARMGLIKSDCDIIVELREWLRSNFKNEYINIF